MELQNCIKGVCYDSDWNVLTDEPLYVYVIIPCTHVVKTIYVSMNTVSSIIEIAGLAGFSA